MATRTPKFRPVCYQSLRWDWNEYRRNTDERSHGTKGELSE
jgi:hypothetical protein